MLRPVDLPPRDGRVRRLCLAALETPRTVAELALVLRWDRSRASVWVHWLRRRGLVVRVGSVTGRGGTAGRYQAMLSQRGER